jgi:hypothetical protein
VGEARLEARQPSSDQAYRSGAHRRRRPADTHLLEKHILAEAWDAERSLAENKPLDIAAVRCALASRRSQPDCLHS